MFAEARYGAREEMRSIDHARRLDRAAQGLLCALLISRVPKSGTQTQEQLGKSLLVDRVFELEHLEGALVVRDGLLVAVLLFGPLGGQDRIVDRLYAVPLRRSLTEVVGELCQVGLRLLAVELFERLPDLSVQQYAARRGGLLVECFTDQCVAEAVPGDSPRPSSTR